MGKKYIDEESDDFEVSDSQESSDNYSEVPSSDEDKHMPEEDFVLPVRKKKKTVKQNEKKKNLPNRSSISKPPVTPKPTAISSGTNSNNAGRQKKLISPIAKKKTPSPAVLTQSQASEEVLAYMIKANRPYSAINVFDNLHKRIPKSAITTILDNLSKSQDLKCKTYGKSNVYYVNQENIADLTPDEIRQLDSNIATMQLNCKDLEKEVQLKTNELVQLNNQISDSDLELKLSALRSQILNLENKIETCTDPRQKAMAPDERNRLQNKCSQYRVAWVKRKRIVVDAVDQIADGMEKKPKQIYAMCDIETDLNAGFNSIPLL